MDMYSPKNSTDAYTIQSGEVEIPVVGTEHVISGSPDNVIHRDHS